MPRTEDLEWGSTQSVLGSELSFLNGLIGRNTSRGTNWMAGIQFGIPGPIIFRPSQNKPQSQSQVG